MKIKIKESGQEVKLGDFIYELYETEDESFSKLKSFFMSERDDKQLESVIIKLYEFSRSYPSPEKWLQEIAEYFNPQTDINLPILRLLVKQYFIKNIGALE